MIFSVALVIAGIGGTGAAGVDSRSLHANPALAVGATGTDVSFDLTPTMVWLSYQREPYVGTDPNTDPDRSFNRETSYLFGTSPSLAMRHDGLFGPKSKRFSGKRGGEPPRYGVGVAVFTPSASSITTDPEGSGRYHVVSAFTFTAYVPVVAAWKVTPRLRVGGGPVLAVSQLTYEKRVDLAPSLQALSPSDPPVAPEQPLLEGSFSTRGAIGFTAIATAGVLWDVTDDVRLGFSVYSPGSVTMHGRSRLQPSLDFNVHSVADFSLRQNLPTTVNAGARVRPGEDWQVTFEGQWVDASVQETSHAKISNSRLRSDQADVQLLLDTLGISESELVEGILDKDQPTVRGSQDWWSFLMGTEYANGPWRVRGEAGYFRASIPDAYVSPSNLDFDNLVLGAGAGWKRSPRFSMFLMLFHYVNGGRTVSNSRFSTHSARGAAYQYPTGNGVYEATILRAVLSTQMRF